MIVKIPHSAILSTPSPEVDVQFLRELGLGVEVIAVYKGLIKVHSGEFTIEPEDLGKAMQYFLDMESSFQAVTTATFEIELVIYR